MVAAFCIVPINRAIEGLYLGSVVSFAGSAGIIDVPHTTAYAFKGDYREIVSIGCQC